MGHEAINKALFDLKNKIGKMTKDSTNPFFKSRYFDINQLLEHVEPLASENRLIILQPIIDGKVRTEIIHVDSGEMKFSELSLSDNKNPQNIGSEITYYRRYTLSSLLGIQAVDDDGNIASQTTETKPQPKQEKELEWLNLFDKNNNPTTKFGTLKAQIEAGKTFTLAEIRKSYKVSKITEQQLLTNFNIK